MPIGNFRKAGIAAWNNDANNADRVVKRSAYDHRLTEQKDHVGLLVIDEGDDPDEQQQDDLVGTSWQGFQ